MSGGGLGDKVAVGTWRIHVNAEKKNEEQQSGESGVAWQTSFR